MAGVPIDLLVTRRGPFRCDRGRSQSVGQTWAALALMHNSLGVGRCTSPPVLCSGQASRAVGVKSFSDPLQRTQNLG